MAVVLVLLVPLRRVRFVTVVVLVVLLVLVVFLFEPGLGRRRVGSDQVLRMRAAGPFTQA